MSRLSKTPIYIPKGIEVKVEKQKLQAKGPKGVLELQLQKEIKVKIEENKIFISNNDEGTKEEKSMLGLQWALIRNVIEGIEKGYEKRLALIGVGFRASVQGTKLDLKVGFSHPTIIEIPKGITVKVEKGTEIIITGIDKQLVGQFAAEVREIKKPEPYKGKGIRYKNEYVRKKAGKTAKAK